MSRYSRAFTLPEALVMVAVLAASAAVALAALNYSHRITRTVCGTVPLRGIHQSMVLYAQGNNGYFPGLTSQGKDNDLSVEHRYQIMLDANYFTGEYLISPNETKTTWTTGKVTTANYSYAMLQIPETGGRRYEWSQTLNTNAIVMSDRNIGTTAKPRGLDSNQAHPGRFLWLPVTRHYPSHWVGTVVFNDNHVTFETTSILPTAYDTDNQGHQQTNPHDRLFQSTGPNDALMIYSGN